MERPEEETVAYKIHSIGKQMGDNMIIEKHQKKQIKKQTSKLWRVYWICCPKRKGCIDKVKSIDTVVIFERTNNDKVYGDIEAFKKM